MRAFKKRITLQKLKSQIGRNTAPQVEVEAVVFAAIADIGVTTKLQADTAGESVSLAVYTYRRYFEKIRYTHAVIDSVRYKIIKTGATENDLIIKLLLERG